MLSAGRASTLIRPKPAKPEPKNKQKIFLKQDEEDIQDEKTFWG
jgi:hypothetical protein